MKKLALLIFALSASVLAQNRYPSINLVTGDPTGTTCYAPSIVQSATNGGLYVCDTATSTYFGGPGPFLPLAGGTLTGPLSGTRATFSGPISASSVGLLGTFQMNSGQGLNILSDSTCNNGTGATAGQRGWAMLTAAYSTTGPTQYLCHSGYQLADIERQLMLPTVEIPSSGAPVSLAENTINEVRSGDTTGQLTFWQQMDYFFGAYLSTPFSAIIHGDDSAQITQGGSWTLDTALGFPIALATSTPGNTLTFTVTTTTANEEFTFAQRVWNADTGTNTVSIDGTVATDQITGLSTLTNAPFTGGVVNTPDGTTDVVVAARFIIPTAGTHTIVYTCVTAGTHGCSFFGAWTPQSWSTVYQPPVYVQDGNPYQNNDTNSAITAAYNTQALNTAALLKSDGYNVYSVNLRATMNSTTSMTAAGTNVSGLTVTDAAITSAQYTLTSTQANFTSYSIGKYAVCLNAGPNPGQTGTTLSAKIQSVSGNVATLEFPAGATISAGTCYIGTLGQVIPASVQGGPHPNDYGHWQWAQANLAVINPAEGGKFGGGGVGTNPNLLPESSANAITWPSNIGWLGSFPTAGSNDSGGNLNQGWCAFNTGQRFGCFGWGDYTTTGFGTRGPYIAFDGGPGSPDYTASFNVFGSAKSWATSEQDLGSPGFSVSSSGTYVNGLKGNNQVVLQPSGTAVAGTNYGTNAFFPASWSIWNGTSASSGTVDITANPLNGTNATQQWIWHGCQGATFSCIWYIENFASVQFTESLYATSDFHVTGGSYLASLAASTTAPTISSGFGTSPTVPSNNGTAAFTVNVGTGGTATSGVMAMPAASHGWACQINDLTNPGANFTKVSATTTASVTVTNYNSSGTATAWSASDILVFQCTGY